MRTLLFVGLVALSANGLAAQSSPAGERSLVGGCDLLVRLRLNTPARDLSMPRVAAEVRAIWAPYLAIQVTERDAPTPCADEIRVVIDGVSSGASDALGWIRFVDGRPSHDVIVSLARARRLVNSGAWMGRAASEWPPETFRHSLSQAVGRATAHEVGHFVLRMPGHAPAGLMRASLSADDVIRPRGSRFELTGVDTRRAR